MRLSSQKHDSPTTFVVFGATGDLFRHKLLTAIFELQEKHFLPSEWRLIACGRKEFSDEAFRMELKALLTEGGKKNTDEFLARVSYHQGLFDDRATYDSLAQKLGKHDESYGQCSNKLFYLAVPPSLYETILNKISESGLAIGCSDGEGWTRILVEKPFGKDLESGRKLDALLGTLFKEEQIFRIDHYLAKETVQNILTFRFGNSLFEPIWNSNMIESVSIRLWEKNGIGKRGGFYSDTGALRDVGQNHLLQMAALVALDEPSKMDAEAIRASRGNVLKALRLFSENDLKMTVRAQYEGFTEEATAEGEETETYFRLPVYFDLPRWKNVPFYLESGKAMSEAIADITIAFNVRHSILPDNAAIQHNVLTFRIQPNEGISILFFAKKPGLLPELEPRELTFAYAKEKGETLSDAYEKVLYDCIRGDQTLFASTEEVLAAWSFITPILSLWKKIPLARYKKGGRGPASQDGSSGSPKN